MNPGRVNQELNTEKKFLTDLKIGFGIGRPVNESWIRSFSQAFDELSPDELSFMRPILPGVVYVRPHEIAQELDDPLPNIRSVERVGLNIVRAVNEQMTSSTIEEGEARFSLMRFRASISAVGQLCVRARIRDIECIKYPESYIIQGERSLVRGAYNLPSQRPHKGRSIPRPNIYLGHVMGPKELLTVKMLEQIKRQMSGGVMLDPLNVVQAPMEVPKSS